MSLDLDPEDFKYYSDESSIPISSEESELSTPTDPGSSTSDVSKSDSTTPNYYHVNPVQYIQPPSLKHPNPNSSFHASTPPAPSVTEIKYLDEGKKKYLLDDGKGIYRMIAGLSKPNQRLICLVITLVWLIISSLLIIAVLYYYYANEQPLIFILLPVGFILLSCVFCLIFYVLYLGSTIYEIRFNDKGKSITVRHFNTLFGWIEVGKSKEKVFSYQEIQGFEVVMVRGLLIGKSSKKKRRKIPNILMVVKGTGERIVISNSIEITSSGTDSRERKKEEYKRVVGEVKEKARFLNEFVCFNIDLEKARREKERFKDFSPEFHISDL